MDDDGWHALIMDDRMSKDGEGDHDDGWER
jgi:hypothetical protein